MECSIRTASISAPCFLRVLHASPKQLSFNPIRQLHHKQYADNLFMQQRHRNEITRLCMSNFLPRSQDSLAVLQHSFLRFSSVLSGKQREFQKRKFEVPKLYYSSSFQDTLLNSRSETDQKFQRKKKNILSNPIRNDRLQHQSILREVIAEKGDTPWTAEDWVSTAEVLASNASNQWDIVCMHTLYLDKNLPLGRSLMQYLESQTEVPSLVVLTFYIGLLGETCAGSEKQEEETKQYYDILLSRSDLLDAASIEVLVSGLSSTKYYHECLKLLDICRESSRPGPRVLVNTLRAGLRNQDSDTCARILSQFEDAPEPTSFNAFAAQVIDECLAVKNETGLQMVMDFMQKHRLLLPRKALDEIRDSFYSHQPQQWMAKYGYIHHKGGNCVVCGHQMPVTEISDSDFKAVQAAFLDQVIVGDNIFYKTSPEEVDNFVKFVKKMGPFDVVIDGMNVIHKGPKPPQKERLEKAVEYFLSQGKKILILGSKALLSYTRRVMKMKPKPDIYMTSTTKADDVFFLYAALHSGKDALIVSHDKLRDHKFRLHPSLRHIFLHWLMSAQVYDWYFSRYGDFAIRRRSLFNIGPIKDEGGWHIPEMDEDLANPFGKFTVLCLRDKTKETALSAEEFNTDRISKAAERRKPANNYKKKDRQGQKKTSINITKEWFES